MVRAQALLAVLFSMLMPATAPAHHSRAAYDMTREVLIEGTVTELAWRNPHIFFTLETTGAGGAPERVEIEVMSVAEAAALGLRREAMAPGTRVVVRGHPARSSGARAVGLDMRAADGAVYPLNLEARVALRPAPVPADGIAGRWVPTIESFYGATAAGASWPRTPAAGPAWADFRRKLTSANVSVQGICEPIPPPVLSIYPDLRTIELTEASIVIRAESSGVYMERVVHLNQNTHPANVAPSLMGHSTGRWEGRTLVIDTVAFAPNPVGGWYIPSGPNKHLVERLSLTEDRLALEYSFTLEDPAVFTAPVSYTAIWEHRPDLELSPEPCDPDVARRHLAE